MRYEFKLHPNTFDILRPLILESLMEERVKMDLEHRDIFKAVRIILFEALLRMIDSGDLPEHLRHGVEKELDRMNQYCSRGMGCPWCYEASLRRQREMVVSPHIYRPSSLHMGDCSICGHTRQSPVHDTGERLTTVIDHDIYTQGTGSNSLAKLFDDDDHRPQEAP